VVPRVNHLSADNLVPGAAGKKQTHPPVPGLRTAFVEQLSDSSSSSSEDDMEQYEKEPGIRRPGSRSCSEDLDIDLEEYNEEPMPRKQERGTRTEEQASQKVDSGLPAKKKHKKGPRLEIGGENKSHGFADHVRNSPGISEDVWKEAMAGVPLASSESFDTRLPSSKKDQSANLGDDDDGDVFERRSRRKGKPTRSKDPLSDLQWSADLPINDSLSRDTLDDISCDSYVPPEQISGWDVDSSLEVNLDDYLEEGSAKVLDMLARSSDSSQGRVVGRRRERVDKEHQRKQTLSRSFETNIDDIEFDTEPQGNVSNIGKVKQPGNVPNTGRQESPPPEVAADIDMVNQNVPNIKKTKQPDTGEKGKRKKAKGNGNVSNIDKTKELVEETATDKGKKGGPRQPAQEEMEAEDEKGRKEKTKKRRGPVSNISEKKSATIPIIAADAAAGSVPFEEDEESYSGEPKQDLSADINVRLWEGPTTNIDETDDDDEDVDDDDDEDQDQLPSNLHDQRLDEDSTAQSDEEKPMLGKPPTSSTSYPTSQKVEVIDMLPDRPRRAQPVAGDEPQSSRQRKPPARTTARRPYNGVFTFSNYQFSSVSFTLSRIWLHLLVFVFFSHGLDRFTKILCPRESFGDS